MDHNFVVANSTYQLLYKDKYQCLFGYRVMLSMTIVVNLLLHVRFVFMEHYFLMIVESHFC